ncbi:MAG: nucleotidyltransferase family protein, partial [Roseiflexaceae bacterium]
MTSIQKLLAHARAEDRLLLACARTTIDQLAADQIKSLLRPNIDWEYLTERADLHCVTPLLNRSLSMVSPDAIPAQALMPIRQRVREIAQSNLHLTGELLRLLTVFDQQSIPIIPFKGPTLAMQAYGDIALRPFGDLDVLIHAQDLMPARELMLAQGYQPLPE